MRTILFTIAALTFSLNALAQHEGHECKKKEQIKLQKVNFITEKLQLTVEESQQFWPLYNEAEKKIDGYEKEMRQIMKKYKESKDVLTDAEVNEMADKMTELQVLAAKTEAEYFEKYKKVLSVRKVMELRGAEKEFHHDLLKQLKGGPPCRQ